jgi:hypothetical protein
MKPLLLLLCLPALALAQFYNISTIAGNGLIRFQGGSHAVNTVLIVPTAVAVDASGNAYVGDTYFNQVFRIVPGGAISVYASNGEPGFSGDGGPATAAQLSIPIADSGNARGAKSVAERHHRDRRA